MTTNDTARAPLPRGSVGTTVLADVVAELAIGDLVTAEFTDPAGGEFVVTGRVWETTGASGVPALKVGRATVAFRFTHAQRRAPGVTLVEVHEHPGGE